MTCGSSESCEAGVCESPGCSVRDTASGVEDTCTGENICQCPGSPFCEGTGTCVSAFGRIYRVGIAQAELPDRNPSGDCWDTGCGAPDPYVVLSVDGTVVDRTPTASDTFTPAWSPVFTRDVTIVAGSDLRLDVFDEDIADDDGAFACVFEPISAARLRSRDLSCDGALGELTSVVVFVP